jgi:hypothetical protein
MVVISNGLLPFSTPWEEIGKEAAGAGIPAFACFTRARPTREGRESFRAAAYRALSSGLSGIELWNYFYEMPFYHRPDEEYLGLGFTDEVADMESLRKARKSYLLESGVETSARLMATFGHATWAGQIPLTIGFSSDGIGQTVIFDIADDLTGQQQDSRPTLFLQILDLAPTDKVEFLWNGEPIQADPQAFPGVTVFDKWEFKFDLSARQVKRGKNQLELRLVKRDPRLEPFVTLTDGRLTIPETA